MSDRQALVEAIRGKPDEDTPRLILADWYEENGDAARGEFIRVQCELARIDPSSERYPELHLRQLQLLAEHERDWLGDWAEQLVRWEFRRGMLEDVTICPEPYCRTGDVLFRDHPIWRVAFVDGEGESLAPPTIRDVLRQSHSRYLRAIDAAGCKPGEQASAMFGGQIHTNSWLSELADANALEHLQELSLYGGTRSGRDDIDLAAWEAFCSANHLRGLTHLDVSNHYDYHGDSASWEPILNVLAKATFAAELRSLKFDGCYVGSDAIPHLIHSRQFTQLQKLTVGSNVNYTDIASVLPAILDPNTLPALRELTIPYGRHLAATADHPGWTRFERLEVIGGDAQADRTRATNEPIWRAFFRSPHIHPKAFVLHDPGYSDPEEVGLWEELAGARWFGNLRQLAIRFFERTSSTLFQRALPQCTHLQTLALNPSTEVVERLAVWPALANLMELDLNDSFDETEPKAAVRLFESPYLTSRLSKLRASGVCRSPEAVKALAGCAALAGLTHLDFAFNELSEESAATLAASPYLRNLKSLHTWSEWDEFETLSWLTLANPTAFPQLRDVVVGSGTTEQIQEELRRRFGPRLRVFADC